MKQSPKNWTLAAMAQLIGLRALGQDYEFIADRLDCTESEARGMLQAVRGHLKAGLWVEDLLTDSDHRVIEERDLINRSAGTGRKYRVKLSCVHAAKPQRNVTAELMGDPQPGRVNPPMKEL